MKEQTYPRRRNPFFALMVICVLLTVGAGGQEAEILFDDALVIGPEQFFFGSVTDICEDGDGNFFVLDRTETRVHKFSPDGIHLLSFGRKGQGPGDLNFPARITLTPEGNIAVSEDMGQVNLFGRDGSFIGRVTLSGRLNTAYVGEDRFYAWIWREADRQQVLVDRKNNIIATFGAIPKSAFSASLPDSSGRAVMFNYSREEYSPGFVFGRSRLLSAVALGDRYLIRLLDGKGEIVSEIKREIKPPQMQRSERAFFRRELEKTAAKRKWPAKIVNDLMKNIPAEKVFFSDVLVNTDHVFVFRIPEDVSDPEARRRVDLFHIDGRFLGTLGMEEKPVALSDSQAYFARSDEEGNITLIRRSFTLNYPGL